MMNIESMDLAKLNITIARMDRYMALNRVYEGIRKQMEDDKEGCPRTYLKCLELVNGIIGKVIKGE